MATKFYWSTDVTGHHPVCTSDLAMHGDVSLLSCILMDDGGVGIDESICWLDEGVRRIDYIRKNNADTMEWGREGWIGLISFDTVKIFSSHDENYSAVIETNVFEECLRKWIVFIKEKSILAIISI
ncbi:hypothetical protein [Leeia aquatica]|uniref:Uncharacterized protein n=1 Tax=Leeia aquatica TaxID=2725557 RepID=A0A847S9Y3_9NEIS|nr:hypothetical protein [Leeia aquatica]NLR74366.1 hypothetical protein [Leeia aquatica]